MSPARPATSRRFEASAIRSWIRRRSRFRTVPGRLTFWYVGTLALGLGAFATFVLIVRAGSLRREFDADLSSRAGALGAEIRPLLDHPDVARRLAEEAGLASMPVAIRSADGRIVHRSRAFPALPPEWELAAGQGAASGLVHQTIRDAAREEQRLANHAVRSPAGTPYVVQLVAHPASIDEGIRELAVAQGIGLLLVLIAATYGSAFTARRALAPIDEIIRRGREIRAHDLGKRLHVEADTVEIELLVRSVNEMLERLEEPVHRAHRFAANVSHELQTPLTAMRFAIEDAQRSGRTAERYREIADDLLTEIDRLSLLIRDLRLLAIAGAGQLVAHPEAFDLGEVVQQCCEIARAVADGKRITIDERVLPGVTVAGSALHLRRVILNLTDNAIRYSPCDSTVSVRMECDEGVAEVTVSDRGCGIAADDLPRIFEPFFRADRARTRETGGSGLGLAIADQIVRAHHGRITVESEPNDGAAFTIHVPVAAGAAETAGLPRSARIVALDGWRRSSA
jgi:signal transduction histidine kinase